MWIVVIRYCVTYYHFTKLIIIFHLQSCRSYNRCCTTFLFTEIDFMSYQTTFIDFSVNLRYDTRISDYFYENVFTYCLFIIFVKRIVLSIWLFPTKLEAIECFILRNYIIILWFIWKETYILVYIFKDGYLVNCKLL